MKPRLLSTISLLSAFICCGMLLCASNPPHILPTFQTTSKLILMERKHQPDNDNLIGEKFPMIAAETLAGNPITLPRDLSDNVCVLTVAFKQAAQAKIDTWAEYVLDQNNFQDVCYYEIPLIKRIWKPLQGWIDGGMRSGIPEERHKNVITYYGDIRPYKRHLNVSDTADAYVFVIDKEGCIRYASQGYASPEKLQELKTVIDGLKQIDG